MNNPHDRTSPFDTPLHPNHKAHALIANYLDFLCAPTLGILPYEERHRLRAEATDHILAMVADAEATGVAPVQAATKALKEYGDPWKVGQASADAWMGGAGSSPFARVVDAATMRAFAWFGIATVVNLLLIERGVLWPYADWVTPFAQNTAIISPLIAGVMTGLGLNSKATMGIVRALVLFGILDTIVGLMLRPRVEGEIFAGFVLLFWSPAGCLSSAIASSLRRQFLLRRFSYTTR